MKKLITTMAVAALLAGSAAPPVLARGGQRDHGIWQSPAYHAGSYFKHRPRYGYRQRYWRHWPGYRYRHWPPRHYRHRQGHGGYYYFHGDGAVVLGALAGAVVLGTLLSRAPAPSRPPVLRSPTGAPLGGCLQTTGTGTWHERPAQFSGTMCYDPAGRAYVLPGSERFVGYLR